MVYGRLVVATMSPIQPNHITRSALTFGNTLLGSKMHNGYYFHFYNGETDISGSIHAEDDADCVIIWHEIDGHIMSFVPAGFGWWQADDITESFGYGYDHWRNQEFDSMESALAAIIEAALMCV